VASTHDAANIAGDSLALQRISFQAGKTSALQLIVAENTYSNVRLAYVKAQGQQLADVAALFVALGGGWWSSDDFTAATDSGRDSQSP
jgi:outer membrane protein TolC